MLIVVSPAKKLDEAERPTFDQTIPALMEDANKLAKVAAKYSVTDLQNLMSISPTLAKLNKERFASFGEQSGKAAIFMFAGDTYQGLDAKSLDDDDLRWAQDHFRILSGLYGVLRPLDTMEPYRLEMGSRVKTKAGNSLYDFWGDRIAKNLRAQAAEVGTDVLVNCASTEYFTAVDQKALGLRVITPVFMELKAEGPKIVSFYAKRARGAMARYIIERRLTDPAALVEFDTGGYKYVPDMSEENKPVFLRAE